MKEWTEGILRSKTDKPCDYLDTSRVGTGVMILSSLAWMHGQMRIHQDKETSWDG